MVLVLALRSLVPAADNANLLVRSAGLLRILALTLTIVLNACSVAAACRVLLATAKNVALTDMLVLLVLVTLGVVVSVNLLTADIAVFFVTLAKAVTVTVDDSAADTGLRIDLTADRVKFDARLHVAVDDLAASAVKLAVLDIAITADFNTVALVTRENFVVKLLLPDLDLSAAALTVNLAVKSLATFLDLSADAATVLIELTLTVADTILFSVAATVLVEVKPA